MFMNADPRIVSNGFETFVPAQIVDLVHQRLVKMTNSNVNAWSVFGPVATSANATWEQQIDDFGANENYLAHNLYGGCYPESAPLARTAALPLSRINSYTTSNQSQYQSRKRHPASQQPQQQQEPQVNMNCLQRPSPMLEDPYSQWATSRGRGSFAEFSATRQGLEDHMYQNSNEMDVETQTANAPLAHQLYKEQASEIQPCYDFGFTNATPISTMVSQPMIGYDLLNDPSLKNSWVPETPRQSHIPAHQDYGLNPGYDGLPNSQNVEPQGQQSGDIWSTNTCSTHNWNIQDTTPSTISPKLLTLNVSNATFSFSGSSQGSEAAQTDSSSPSVADDRSDYSGPEVLEFTAQPIPSRTVRQKLPDALPSSQKHPQKLRNERLASPTKSKRKPPSMSRSSRHNRTKHSSPGRNTSKATASNSLTNPSEPDPQKNAIPKRLEPKPNSPKDSLDVKDPPRLTATAQIIHCRDAKDDFLVRSKLAGMSYKDIRRQGKFTEAESTLRGRFRTLTKHKTARVRKPEWNDNDIRLLKRAVRKLTNGADTTQCKVPWKQVAEYISDHGGSYHFGNATCRKRWDELQEGS